MTCGPSWLHRRSEAPSSALGHVSVSFENKIYLLWCIPLIVNTIYNVTGVFQASRSKFIVFSGAGARYAAALVDDVVYLSRCTGVAMPPSTDVHLHVYPPVIHSKDELQWDPLVLCPLRQCVLAPQVQDWVAAIAVVQPLWALGSRSFTLQSVRLYCPCDRIQNTKRPRQHGATGYATHAKV